MAHKRHRNDTEERYYQCVLNKLTANLLSYKPIN